jgi:hypothetical protein
LLAEADSLLRQAHQLGCLSAFTVSGELIQRLTRQHCAARPSISNSCERRRGDTLPPNTRAELRRDMARLRLITDQIREFEAARAARIDHAPAQGANAMVLLLARVVGVGLETADMLVHETPPAACATAGRWRATPASPGHRTRALI